MFEIDPTEVLLTLAEISVAFAGFASIVAIFQRRGASGGAGFDRFRFWVLLEFSLASLLFALLPFPLRALGLAPGLVWVASGLGMVAFLVGHGIVVERLSRRGHPVVVASQHPALRRAALLVYLVIVTAQVGNALWLQRFGPYLLGVFLLLLGSGVNFVRLVQVGLPSDRG